jgi:hypothetical protein
MSIDRAPKGIPTGGQFVTAARAEPHLTLVRATPAVPEPARPRNLGISAGGARIIDWDTKDPVSYKSVTPEEMSQLEQLSAESGVSIPTIPLLTSFKRRGHREIGTRSSRPFDFTDFKYLHSDDLTADERELMADLMPDILAQEKRDTQDIPAVGRNLDGSVASAHTEPSISPSSAKGSPTLKEKFRGAANRALDAVEGFSNHVDTNHSRDMAEAGGTITTWGAALPKFMRRNRS